jgi:hypothetical protein
MATSPTAQYTDFTRDVLRRYTCNGLDEACPDVNPFDVIVIGGGSFGPIFAQHLLYHEPTRARRTLVLEVGRLVLPEHVQNLQAAEQIRTTVTNDFIFGACTPPCAPSFVRVLMPHR